MGATPVVTATFPIVNAAPGEAFTASQLFTASDIGGDPILDYQVEDESTGASNGFWVLNGAVLPSGQITDIPAAQLPDLMFVAGVAALDSLEVAASDSSGFGALTSFYVAAASPAGSTPVISAANALEAPSLNIAAASLFSASVASGGTVTGYEVEDTTADSGHWIFNGTVEPAAQLIYVSAAQLSELSFATGYGTDTILVRANAGGSWSNFTTFAVQPPPNPFPPVGTMAELVMARDSDGAYEIYDIGRNTILLDGPLGAIDPAWEAAAVGGFDGDDTADLLMRDPATGVFELNDVSGNAFTGSVALGQVGLEWQVAGFGDFSGNAGETDMLMRNSNTGAFEVYDISNNAIALASGMGQVGLAWQVAGFGDFSTRLNETDMLMRNSNTGAFEVYDISNNAITLASGMGQVGLEWQVAGFGDFSTHANETDMLLRNSDTGAFEVYDIVNNTITLATGMGQVGLEWTVAGFGDFSGNADETDMLMRNSTSGVFELYDISNNTITSTTAMGQVGPEWSIAGVTSGTPAGSQGTALSNLSVEPAEVAPSNSVTQLTQAMASFATDSGALAASSPLGQAPSPPASANPLAAPANSVPQV
jgi:hypothetical protein